MVINSNFIYQLSGGDLKDFAFEVARQIREAGTPTPAPTPSDEWGTREQAANILGVCLVTIHGLMNKGLLETRKIGRRTVVNLSKLRRDLAEGRLGRYKR